MAEQKTPIPMSWEVRLHGVYNAMGAAERRVADYFSMQGFSILTQSIAEISDATEASEATTVRFCRRIGYGGLKDFKIALATEQAMLVPGDDAALGWDDDVDAACSKTFQGAIKALKDTMTLLDDVALARAVRALLEARYIDIYATGGSAPIGQYLHTQLMQIGVRAELRDEAQMQKLALPQLEAGDCVVAISISGQMREVVNAVRWAREQGASTIAITNDRQSPLANAAEVLLMTTGGPFLLGGQGTLTRFSQLAVVDTLYLGAALALGQKHVEAVSARRGASQTL